MKNVARAFLLISLVFTAACARDIGATTYGTNEAGAVSRTEKGVIVSARPVKVTGTDSGVGKVGGAAAGGVAGSMIGGDSEINALGAIGGAILGGMAGKYAEEKATGQGGMEYVVELDTGELITVVQGTDETYSAGQQVLVIHGTERTRVRPY